jgi:hypothetical protein
VVTNPALLPHERAHIVTDAQPHLEMSPAEVAASVMHHRRADLHAVPLARPMLYTSGTTGTPKGVYSGVLGESLAERLWGEEIELWQLGPQDRYVQIGPPVSLGSPEIRHRYAVGGRDRGDPRGVRSNAHHQGSCGNRGDVSGLPRRFT